MFFSEAEKILLSLLLRSTEKSVYSVFTLHRISLLKAETPTCLAVSIKSPAAIPLPVCYSKTPVCAQVLPQPQLCTTCLLSESRVNYLVSMACVSTRTISAKQPQRYKLTPRLRHTLGVAVTNIKNRAQMSCSVLQEVWTGLWQNNKFKGPSSSELSGSTCYRRRKGVPRKQ